MAKVLAVSTPPLYEGGNGSSWMCLKGKVTCKPWHHFPLNRVCLCGHWPSLLLSAELAASKLTSASCISLRKCPQPSEIQPPRYRQARYTLDTFPPSQFAEQVLSEVTDPAALCTKTPYIEMKRVWESQKAKYPFSERLRCLLWEENWVSGNLRVLQEAGIVFISICVWGREKGSSKIVCCSM